MTFWINPYGLVLSCYDLLSYPSGELFTSRFIAKIRLVISFQHFMFPRCCNSARSLFRLDLLGEFRCE
jgi:hypothetical protein